MRPKIGEGNSGGKDIFTEFKTYLKIDKDGLDEAMAEQADLLFRASDEYATTVSLRDAAKEKLDTVDAQLGLDQRSAKTDERVTEAAIKERIQTHPKHEIAFTNYTKLKERAERLFGLKNAVQERGRMLRDLSSLYASGYFTVTSSKGAEARLGRGAMSAARTQQ